MKDWRVRWFCVPAEQVMNMSPDWFAAIAPQLSEVRQTDLVRRAGYDWMSMERECVTSVIGLNLCGQ